MATISIGYDAFLSYVIHKVHSIIVSDIKRFKLFLIEWKKKTKYSRNGFELTELWPQLSIVLTTMGCQWIASHRVESVESDSTM